jgi:DAK2 domain fusion protein YloV
MDSVYISGLMLRDMLISAANALELRKQEINELNVFPVPDGDTGTNMSMTMNAAVRELSRLSVCTVAEVSNTAASSLLRGARGNSGVILSLLFRGIARTLSDRSEASGSDFAKALQCGVDAAYKAVMKPAEGTILTVAREAAAAADRAAKNIIDETEPDFKQVFKAACDEAETTLAKTPEMLPVLKKAGVVDAGGKGFVVILQAMLKTLEGGIIEIPAIQPALQSQTVRSVVGEADEEINFTYCTEFIINKSAEAEKDPLALRAFLESMGDCVLVADDNSFIKVHCHTDNPGNAIQEALTYGYLSDMKIDNMRLQHEKKAMENLERVEPEKPYGFVAVAAGKGIAELFTELGADRIVEGGQTMNPSTEDILANIEATPAHTVIVLPNNKNIILAAEQAVSLSDRTVYVLHTKTVPQGLTALLNFDADIDVTSNMRNMEAAAEHVKTGLITFAARDSDFDGNRISKNEIIALTGGKIAFTDSDPVRAAARLTLKMADKNTAYISVIYGLGVTPEQADEARNLIADKLGSQAEINVIEGGQPVYHFIISVE